MTGIVVGVDGSEGAEHALRWAVREAGLHGWPVTAVLAWEGAEHLRRQTHGTHDEEEGDALARAVLDGSVLRAVGEQAAAAVRRRTERHPASRALLDASLDASLLVLGPRGLGGLRGILLGSVSERCLHYAISPVAIIHRTDPAIDGRLARIVVGIDGSDGARRALEWAVEEAVVHQAALEVVHAWTVPYGYGLPYTSAHLDPHWIEDAARATLDTEVDAIDTEGLAQPVERVLVSGGAASAILERAKGADLIVVGSRGRGGFTGLLLGSVGHQVAHHATVPVVVIPGEA